MATAGDVIKSSLRLIGAIAAGETPTASEQADALDVLNDILEDWSNDGFMIFESKIEEFSFTPGTASYAIGSGAAFNTARPQVIREAKFKDASSAYELPLKLWNEQEYSRISLKSTQSSIPQGLFYNPTYPSGTLIFWPVPSAAHKVILHSLKPLSAIASAATSITFPQGYKRALRYNLAVELAPEYGKPVDPKLEQLAASSKAGIQRTNTEPVLLVSDALGLFGAQYFDWRAGD